MKKSSFTSNTRGVEFAINHNSSVIFFYNGDKILSCDRAAPGMEDDITFTVNGIRWSDEGYVYNHASAIMAIMMACKFEKYN